jgi:chloramphenicol-sensitive protein RarD
MPPTAQDQHRGLLYGIVAYGMWGLMPLYFWLVIDRATPLEIVACRVGWSFLVLWLVITATRGWNLVRAAMRQHTVMLALAGSAAMIATNWIAYVYAVATNQILQASFGYFVTPLVNVILGGFFLGERLRGFQTIGIALAAIGVAILGIAGGEVPVISMALAISFGFYGLFRKLAPADGATSLLVETAILAPPAFALFVYLRTRPTAEAMDSATHLLLALSGIVTALPLLFFGASARRLPLTTLGILQYLAPSVQFVFAVLLFNEPLPPVKLVSFACIWTAVAVYTYGSLHNRKNAGEPPELEPVPEDVIETA